MVVELFDVVGDGDESDIVLSIEEDRPHYSARPGLIRKLLPIAVDTTTGKVTSGGSYLFDSVENARRYLHWTEAEYRVDGLLFHERPFVSNLTCFLGSVVGAYDYAPIETSQASKRVQIFQAAPGRARPVAEQAWPRIQAAGGQHGLSAVWLGVDSGSDRIALLTVVSRTASLAGDDYGAWARLSNVEWADELMTPESPVKPLHDACMWVFTVWRPPREGKETLGLWPNSPPLPAPSYHQGAASI
jgi:hypothetical protein